MFKFIKFLSIILLICLAFIMKADAATRTISFSGYTWNVKGSVNTTDRMGPGNNLWSDGSDSVFVDGSGKLHLKVKQKNGNWYSSEVYLSSSLGYGKYSWTIDSGAKNVDTNLVVGLFMYQDDEHELDIEFSDWQYKGGWDYHYSVQPYYNQGNSRSAFLPFTAEPASYVIDWQPGQIIFYGEQNGKQYEKWVYTGANNFVPGGEFTDINFWMIDAAPPSDKKEHELVFSKFTFTPYDQGGSSSSSSSGGSGSSSSSGGSSSSSTSSGGSSSSGSSSSSSTSSSGSGSSSTSSGGSSSSSTSSGGSSSGSSTSSGGSGSSSSSSTGGGSVSSSASSGGPGSTSSSSGSSSSGSSSSSTSSGGSSSVSTSTGGGGGFSPSFHYYFDVNNNVLTSNPFSIQNNQNSTPAIPQMFSDVSSSHPNYEAIKYVKEKGIVGGYADDTFKPSFSINRAEFIKIIITAVYDQSIIDSCTQSSFSDIPSTSWYVKHACVAKTNDIVSGYSDGRFNPSKTINFAEAAKIIVNAFGYSVSSDSVWYRPYINELRLINAIPVTIQKADQDITRGEMAEMIWGLMK